MQHLVVQTSKPAHLNANDWATNGVGRKGEDRVAQHAGWAWGALCLPAELAFSAPQ